MNRWTASNYRQRKANRLALVKPEWIINPGTDEQFYLRKVGGLMSSVLKGYMPSGLTAVAVEAWKEKGVKGLEPENLIEFAMTLTPEERAAGERETKALSEIIAQMCVIPLLSANPPELTELTEEWKAEALRGLKEKLATFDVEITCATCSTPYVMSVQWGDKSKVEREKSCQCEPDTGFEALAIEEHGLPFADLVLDPMELDEPDTLFLFQWAKGLTEGVALKGGNVVSTENFRALSKEPVRGVRTGGDRPEILQAAV